MSGGEDIQLRKFEPSDLVALQAIRAAAFTPVFQSFRDIVGPDIADIAFQNADAEQAKLLSDICAHNSSHEIWVALDDEEGVIGFVSFTHDKDARIGEIGLNAVHPHHAGGGVGQAMYAHALARLKQNGAILASVGVGGDPSHAPARRAYEKAGFGAAIPSLWMYRRL